MSVIQNQPDADAMTEPTPPFETDRKDALWHQALDHVLALRAATADDDRRRAADLWRRADPAHEAAFQDADRLWRLAGRLAPADARRPSAPSRRRILAGGGVALAASIAGVAALTPIVDRLRGAETTGTGETRVILLPDGSRVTLGPDSAAMVDFAGPARRIGLLDGIAFFDVRRDDARPFEVRARDILVTVVGTAFEVKRIGCKVAIAVAAGIVAVSGAAFPGRELHAGDWMVIDTETDAVEAGHRAAGNVASWRDGILVVEDREIRDVVEEIGRWHAGAIVIMDDALGRRRVSGILDLRDPEAALTAVLALYGGRVDRVTPWLLFLSAAG